MLTNAKELANSSFSSYSMCVDVTIDSIVHCLLHSKVLT